MSPPITCDPLGTGDAVEPDDVLDREIVANAAHGPREFWTVLVEGSTYRVPETRVDGHDR